MMSEIVYSVNGEDFVHDDYHEAVIDQMIDLDLSVVEVGDRCHIYSGIKSDKKKPSDFLDEDLVDDLIENMSCRAYDDAGEYADDFDYSLRRLKHKLYVEISEFLNKNLTVDFYGVTEITPVHFTITQVLIDEVTN